MRYLAFVFVLVLYGCNSIEAVILNSPDGDEIVIEVEIADELVERMEGLMARDELPEGDGMLFIFENERKRSFWMKNTLIPLDIMFFDEFGNFVSSDTMEPCEEDPCKKYLSKGSAKYALEVNAGFVEESGIKSGWGLSVEEE